jgi:cytochrome c oxidase assembly protein subunit 15
MTDWRPQGKRWPRDADEWNAEFVRYKEFPEYQRLYKGTDFSLDDFKNIFFWEWAHRMFGRTIGFIFGVPLAVFAMRGQIPRSLAPTLGGLFVLGGSQGLVGWWMVKSGLDKKSVDEIDGGIPRVSPYRLATHLTCAFTIFSLLLWTGLGVLQPRAESAAAAVRPVQLRVKALSLLIGVTAISGAFVAGMQAGYAFNTFPLMEGRIVPEGYMQLQPLYRNFFESVPSVQLHHRVLALSTLGSVSASWLWAQRLPMPPQLRLATDLLLLAAWAQVSLGVATLVNAVPVALGSAHQAGALTLFSVALFTLHTCRVPANGARLLARWGGAAAPMKPC